MSATRRLKVATFCCLVLVASRTLAAADDEPAQPGENRAADVLSFVGGGAAAFALHEAGHLLFDVMFDAHPFVETVHFGPVPFFAVSHRPGVTPRQEFVISSAGFWTQSATSEWLLTRRPDLRHEHAPFAKGVLAFDVLTAIGYGAVALAKAGPYERDTRGMAAGSGVDERAIGVVVIAPAALDVYRYFNPDSRWAKWASRAAKIGAVLLVFRSPG